uniref:Transmembrane BAX inhibitor motif-containing protein 6 n=2 Tax=Terrapene triunguis TaxID=2587831 RepID=A0A674KCA9_9SAUR
MLRPPSWGDLQAGLWNELGEPGTRTWFWQRSPAMVPTDMSPLPCLFQLVQFPEVKGASHPPANAMDVFNRNIDFNALFKFSHISASTQQHLKRVYASFALCMFVAATGAYINVVTHLLRFSLLSGLGSLALLIWLMATPHSRETEQKRLGILAGFAFLTGANLCPLLEMCIAINPSIIPTAFLGTAVIFSCFSLSAPESRRRSFPGRGGITPPPPPPRPPQRPPPSQGGSRLCLARRLPALWPLPDAALLLDQRLRGVHLAVHS